MPRPIYHRHSEGSDPHLNAKIHTKADLEKEAKSKGIKLYVLIRMHVRNSDLLDQELGKEIEMSKTRHKAAKAATPKPPGAKVLKNVATVISQLEEGLQYNTMAWEHTLSETKLSSPALVKAVRHLLTEKVLKQPKGLGTPFFVA